MFSKLSDMDCANMVWTLYNLLTTANSLSSHVEKKALEFEARVEEKRHALLVSSFARSRFLETPPPFVGSQ
ncbi:unnamed protein product [Sphenostylis stenocarpa]|uniref:Uncharacterized protein n=1 Tax=Sphenostylis stenocarpa TaxID=92480 RepID=A0AA86S768_9FABA|nr:unnamed protein product [Sphenostylis stenocarpa]